MGGGAVALGVVEVPEEKNLSEGAIMARQQRRLLQKVVDLGQAEGIEVQPVVRIARQAWQGIQEAIAEEGADLVILGWKGKAREGSFGTTIDSLLEKPPCPLAVVKQRGLQKCRRILVPVRGGPNAELALRLAAALAETWKGTITLLRVLVEGKAWQQTLENRYYNRLLNLARGSRNLRQLTVNAPTIEEGILREAENHELVIMGASIARNKEPYLLGGIAERVVAEAKTTVAVVKVPTDASFFLPSQHISVVVDKWFSRNTFHFREFSDIKALVELKRKSGLSISLGLPALNEEATIGRILSTIKQRLAVEMPLLDEIVLIDSGSTDRTVEIAQEQGIPVFAHSDILPELGSYVGKGEALWKSLYILKGDIIVWVDTDIQNIHPKFVYGLIGPLLKDNCIKLVKGFYRRPLRIGSVVHSTGGGRVTELTARPLINLFFPELSGLIQPLSGEYAGRREALEQIPFFTGYGVEIGMLIDILTKYGLSAIAQCDLTKRVHRNQPTEALSKMAFAIVQVLIKRLEDRERIRLLEDVNRTMKLIRLEHHSYCLDEQDIGDMERPPIVTLPAYQKRLAAVP
jgi:glucosyl-3-phosphoglycerate synthase